MSAKDYKKKGNDAFNAQNYDEAIEHYSEAIRLDPSGAVYYSNRAAVYATLRDARRALDDANMCIQLDPSFVKGYIRKGQALYDLERWDEADSAYREGLMLDPSNDKCKAGLQTLAERPRVEKKSNSASSSNYAPTSNAPTSKPADRASPTRDDSDEQSSSLLQHLYKKLRSAGLSGQMIVFLIVIVGYMGYMWLNEKGKPEPPEPDEPEHTDQSFQPPMIKRNFIEAKTSWLSYMESQGEGDTLLLLLHRTPLSAESEFGDFLTHIASKTANSPLPGGVHMLAPDRPCHGYSTCPASGSPSDGAWLNKLIGKISVPRRLVLVAAGKEASLQALSLCRKRNEPVYLVLISPRSKAPRPRATSGSPLFQWLNRTAEDMTIRAAADTALWTSHALADPSAKSPSVTQHVSLPKGSKITILYLTGDQIVDDVEYELDLTTKGSLVQVRWCPSASLTSESLLSAIWEMLPVGLASAEDEEFDDTL